MSSRELIRAYLSERYPARVFVPLAVLLFAGGTVAAGGAPTIAGAISGIGLAYTLVLFFRVWDDLADRGADQPKHPDRVMVRAPSTGAFRVLMAALVLLAIALLATRPGSVTGLAVFAILGVTLGIWYSLRTLLGASALVSAHVILLKYPAIAFIAATPPAEHTTPAVATAIVVLAAIYLGLCLHELLHDSAVRTARGGALALTVELALLASLLLRTLSVRGFQP
jgi:hypothetical protein